MQVKLYVEVTVGTTDSVPEIAFAPVHAPEAVQLVAFVADHERVDDWPVVIEVGVAVKVTTGGGMAPGGKTIGGPDRHARLVHAETDTVATVEVQGLLNAPTFK